MSPRLPPPSPFVEDSVSSPPLGPKLSFSLMRWTLLVGVAALGRLLSSWLLGTGSDGRRASVSWTVRMCLARASERVKLRSHSECVNKQNNQTTRM